MEKDIIMIKSSDIYWKLIDSIAEKPSCIKAWSTRLNIQQNVQLWKNVFLLPHQCVKDVKVCDLQLKIVHRFYACQSKVAKWDSSVNEICMHCGQGKGNILHTFF